MALLPDKAVNVDIGPPASGSWMFWSGQGNDLDNTMSHPVSAAAATPVTAKVRYEIEKDWDYAYLEATSDGSTWTPVHTNLSTNTSPNGQNFGEGITGSTAGAWVDLTATVPAGTTAIRFRYWTDVAEAPSGFRVDDIAVGGQSIGTGETADEGWTFDGFNRQQQAAVVKYFNAYIAENRQYDGYDSSLRTAYNFGFANTRPDWVEQQPYQDGMLVTYWDSSQDDNNVGDHPGHGLILPVDAHPTWYHSADGALLRPRILSADSTFGLEPTDAVTLHVNSAAVTIPSAPAARTFDDTRDYWFASENGHALPHVGRYQPGWYSVDVPKTGTTITVVSQSKQGNQLNLQVN